MKVWKSNHFLDLIDVFSAFDGNNNYLTTCDDWQWVFYITMVEFYPTLLSGVFLFIHIWAGNVKASQLDITDFHGLWLGLSKRVMV